MDIERGIRVAVDTGDVTLGSEKSIQSLKLGKGRLAVVAANSPKEILEDVEYINDPGDSTILEKMG
nr:ribosomal L7Ae/L30e/S12e/Gadd45 family protein [uncultured Methanobrevibacter sp.]